MLATRTETLVQEEVVALIHERIRQVNRELGQVIRDYMSGDLKDFGELSHIYALCELLDSDDPFFTSA